MHVTRIDTNTALQYFAAILRGGEHGQSVAITYAERLEEAGRTSEAATVRADISTYVLVPSGRTTTALQAKITAAVVRLVIPLLSAKGLSLDSVRSGATRGILPHLSATDKTQYRIGLCLIALGYRIVFVS